MNVCVLSQIPTLLTWNLLLSLFIFLPLEKKHNYPTDPSLTGCKFSSDCKLLIIIFNHFLKENSKTEEPELDSITLKLFYIYLLYCSGAL